MNYDTSVLVRLCCLLFLDCGDLDLLDLSLFLDVHAEMGLFLLLVNVLLQLLLFLDPLGLPRFLLGLPLFIVKFYIAVIVGVLIGRAPEPERFNF